MTKTNSKLVNYFIIGGGVLLVFLFLGVGWLNSNNAQTTTTTTTQTTTAGYSWDTDPYRLEMLTSVKNVTLILDYNNGTQIKWEGVDLSNHYTTCYDLVVKFTTVEKNIQYYGSRPLFYITSINGVVEDVPNSHFWLYWVNGVYVQAGCNGFQLHDNDVVIWKYN
jgi:hypothetical protein